MRLFTEVKYAAKVFFNTPDKCRAIKQSLCILKNEGILGLKRAVNAAGQTQEEVEGLYEKQQSAKKEYKEYEQSVLFIIWVLDEEVDISDTYRVTAMQMKKKDRIVVVKTEEKADWENHITCEKVVCKKQKAAACVQNIIMESQQDYVYFIKGGNYLATNMRDEFAEAIDAWKPFALYSDECVFASDNGKIVRYDVNSDFSEYDLYQANQSWQSVMFERELAIKLLAGHVPTDCIENMMLYLMLNATKETKEIIHIAQVLLLKKDILEKRNLAVRRRILEQYFKEIGIQTNVIIQNNRLKLCAYNEQHKVSIIILAEHMEKTKYCVEDLMCNTAHADYELLVVGEAELLTEMAESMDIEGLIKPVPCEKVTTYTSRCNIAAKQASGDIFVFIQEDMHIQSAEWLSELLGVFAFPQIGGVSPKVVREDNTFRYAGIISGGFGFTPIPFNGESSQYINENNKPAFLNRQVSVLSASCMAIRREAFEKAGGFDEVNFTDKFSNAQISFALTRAGYACVYCADSMLVAKSDEWYDSWYIKEHSTAYLELLKNYGEELSNDAYFTNSMKCLYLRGVPIDFRIYQKKNRNERNRKTILMISHDSLLGGATIAFQYAARVLKKNGYYVVWLVQQEGAMLEELEKDGIGYIVDPSFRGSNKWVEYAKNFDLVICNTILLYYQVEILKNIGMNVVWWVHDAKDYYNLINISDFTITNLDKLNVWCVGTFAEKTFREHFIGIPTKVMIYGVPDYASNEGLYTQNVIENPMGKLIFLSIGTIERRKGQDILAEAIRKLDPEVRKECLFVFVGKAVQKNIYEKVQEVAEDYPESIILKAPVNRDVIMQMYSQSDAVLCTSREDPMPVFMTECMMQSKIAICSENTGTAGVLTDGHDGFIYHNNSVDELAEKITYVLKNKDNMQQIQKNARKTYEKYFSMGVFEEKLKIYVRAILGE